MSESPSPIKRRVIHIPNFGGPLIETTHGDQIRIESAEDFQRDDGTTQSVRRWITLAACLFMTAGFATGWMGHAMLFG